MPSTVVQVIIKHPERYYKNYFRSSQLIMRSLYNQMMSARFSELTKQANPPFIQGGSSIGGFLAGLDAASSYVVAKPGELEGGFKAMLTEVERVKRFGFVQTELDRAKASYLTNLESAYKERDKTPSDNYVQEYLQLFLNGDASPGMEYEYNFGKNTVPGIGLAEVNALTKQYITDVNRDVIIMAPEKDKESLPADAVVNNWISAVK